MLVEGPAMDIFPMLFLLANPAMKTAPGDIILKSGEIIDIAVKIMPTNISLNSAHNPSFWAANLG